MCSKVCELRPGGVTASVSGHLVMLEEDGEKFYMYPEEAEAFCRWYAGLDGDAVNPAPAKPPDPATAGDVTTLLDNDETTITREVFYRFVDKQTDEEVWLNAGEMRALHAAATK